MKKYISIMMLLCLVVISGCSSKPKMKTEEEMNNIISNISAQTLDNAEISLTGVIKTSALDLEIEGVTRCMIIK